MCCIGAEQTGALFLIQESSRPADLVQQTRDEGTKLKSQLPNAGSAGKTQGMGPPHPDCHQPLRVAVAPRDPVKHVVNWGVSIDGN